MIKDGVFIERELGQLFIDSLAFRLVRDEARVIERLVSIGIGPGAVVLRRSGFQEHV